MNPSGCIETQSFVECSTENREFFRVQIAIIFADSTDLFDQSFLEISVFADFVNRELKQRSSCFESGSKEDEDLTDNFIVCESLEKL